LIKKLHDAKVPLLAGTDAPAGYDLVPGTSIHRELQLLVRAGLTPLEALQTATLNPALYSGRPRSGGPSRLETLLSRNPLLDINNTRSVGAVVVDGRYYSARELDALRLKVMELAAK